MNTIFGNFLERTIPNLRNAIINLTIGGNNAEMNLEDFKAVMAPEPTPASYKVYTALVSQTGTDELLNMEYPGLLEVGVTYQITDSNNNTCDFTNVGAPNNSEGTSFVATGTTPNSWGLENGAIISYNLGAPTVTVLENTIGNIWFTYSGAGTYVMSSNGLLPSNKTWGIANSAFDAALAIIQPVLIDIATGDSPDTIYIKAQGGDNAGNGILYNTPIEIRVYN